MTAATIATMKKIGGLLGSFLFDMGMVWAIYQLTGKKPEIPTGDDLKTTNGAARAALHILVGKRREKGDEAIFSGLKAQLTAAEQDSIDELMMLPEMSAKAEEFRWTIALIGEKLGEDKAVRALKAVATPPTAQERYHRALADGLLAPENPERKFRDVLELATKLFGKLKRVSADINDDVQTTGAESTLDRWIRNLESKL